ncbi:MAG: MerR family transcriptional regulator, partial [Anaeromicrobium sp.]|uniref:MerR family DNA-binding transcriptional regulator n=1 Tax=Anaeromicrobium sp. TaxID=1929132 RepID=UPI0025E33D5C
MKYLSIAEMSKKLNVSAQTLRNWDKNDKLKPHHTTDSGYRYYSQEQLNKILGIKEKPRKVIGYCRVSSNKQKD